jgi:hypothetical protein
MIKLACPYCNTVFDVVSPAPSKIPCPRCDETVPETARAPEGAHASEVVDPRPHPGNRWMPWVVGGVVLAAVGAFVAQSMWGTKLPPPAATNPAAVAATKPPRMLAALKRLPAETQIVFAIQPAAFTEYTQRKGKSPEIWLNEAGLPGRMFAEFRKLDLAPEQIDHAVIALPEGKLSPVVVLVLRQAKPDDAELRRKWDAKPVVDKPGQFTVELFGWPMNMRKVDDTTFHFATDAKSLEAPASATLDHLPTGLRDALDRLSPASFAWLATDTARPDWAANGTLKAAALFLQQPDAAKRFEKMQAFAVGVAPEPELQATVSVRSMEAKALGENYRERSAAAKGSVVVEGDWATLKLPFDPPQDGVAALGTIFRP